MFFNSNYSSLLVYLRAVGGEVGATSSLAPKIGPLGLVRVIAFSVNTFYLCVLCKTSIKSINYIAVYRWV